MEEKIIHSIIREILTGIENPVIFEIGANRAEDGAIMAQIAGSTIHCFEADKRNFNANPKENLIYNHVAISDKVGEIDFIESDKHGSIEWMQSGSIRKPKNHLKKYPYVSFKENSYPVESITIDEYCKTNPIPDLIWADIQGAEIDMIKGGLDTLPKVKFLYTEFSDEELYEGQITKAQIMDMLPMFDCVWEDDDNILLWNNTLTERPIL